MNTIGRKCSAVIFFCAFLQNEGPNRKRPGPRFNQHMWEGQLTLSSWLRFLTRPVSPRFYFLQSTGERRDICFQNKSTFSRHYFPWRRPWGLTTCVCCYRYNMSYNGNNTNMGVFAVVSALLMSAEDSCGNIWMWSLVLAGHSSAWPLQSTSVLVVKKFSGHLQRVERSACPLEMCYCRSIIILR